MLAIILQVLLLVYHQITTWFDLYPFNGVRYTHPKERYIEALVIFTLMSLPSIGFLLKIEPLINYGAAYYFILFGVECATWWLPYFVGASNRWLAIYPRVHSTTVGVLPKRDKRTAPNLEHLILMVITLSAAVVTARQFLLDHPSGYPKLWIPIIVGAFLVFGVGKQQIGSNESKSVS